MRVRPGFWFLLIFTCLGVLSLATFYQPRLPLHFHVAQQENMPQGIANIHVYLTDNQNLPIEQAQITPDAMMTNMAMKTDHSRVIPQGRGYYMVQVHFSMAGPWAITIQAQASGFATAQQTLHIDVT